MKFLLFSIYISQIFAWSPNSWRSKIPNQMPIYTDLDKLELIEKKISNLAPLVFAGECDNLQESLAKISIGQGFLLMGGDCAESFLNFSTSRVRDTYRLLLQMGMILTYGSGLPVTKIGRIAGQFAKPRSEDYEIINSTKVLTYRGDIINDMTNRIPNPERMLDAYYQSLQTVNILRAFSHGGYADINRLHAWNIDFVEKTKEGSMYRDLANQATKSINFFRGLGVNIKDEKFIATNIYTSHECLLLNYEEALTREDSRSNEIYNCGAHLLWLGERTRQLDGAHLEYMKGIRNPIGIKVSDKVIISDLIDLIKILNPNNIPGKIVLITRMGLNIKFKLPEVIRQVQKNGFNIVWCCDPMHGNTFKSKNSIKTRSFDAIKDEVINFITIHKKMDSIPGGIHLELTSDDVTECIGGDNNSILETDLSKMYLSQCDPRLNCMQSLELAFIIADLLK